MPKPLELINHRRYETGSRHPRIFIIVLNQSQRMAAPYKNGTLADFAAQCVNKVIDNIINKNFDGSSPKNRTFITVLGYGDSVQEVCSGWLKDLDANFLRYETLVKKCSDGTGGIIEIEFKQPIWIEPISYGGNGGVVRAMQMAEEICKAWIEDAPEALVPVVLHITDGVSSWHFDEYKKIANRIKSISHRGEPGIMAHMVLGDSKFVKTDELKQYTSELLDEDKRFLQYCGQNDTTHFYCRDMLTHPLMNLELFSCGS